MRKYRGQNATSPRVGRSKSLTKASRDNVDEALQAVVKGERDRGEINTWAEPDQKSEIQKPRDTD